MRYCGINDAHELAQGASLHVAVYVSHVWRGDGSARVGSGVADRSVCDVAVRFPSEYAERGWWLSRSMERLDSRKSSEVSTTQPIVCVESAIVVPAFLNRPFAIPRWATGTGHHDVPARAFF